MAPGCYQTRFWVDENAGRFLSAFGDIWGRCERRLYLTVSGGTSAESLKKEFSDGERISSRLFNSLVVSVRGRIDCMRENLRNHEGTLEEQIVKGKRVLKKLERKGLSEQVHQKKRRLHGLESRLAGVEIELGKDVPGLCFGSRKLFKAQFSLKANGYSTHDEWLREWRRARSGSFFLLGSRDENGGNQMCVATVQADGLVSLRLRIPNRLRERGEDGKETGLKYVYLKDLHFNHGHHQLLAALDSCREYRKYRSEHPGVRQKEIPRSLGQAVSYLFKLDRKGWRVFAMMDRVEVPVVTSLGRGAVGVDLNADHLAVTEVDRSGNWLNSFSIPLVTYGKSADQASAITGDAVAELVGYAREVGKPVAFEKVDFSETRAQLEGERPGYSRMLSSFAYGRFREYLASRGQKEGVEVFGLNPAYTSLIGRVKYKECCGASVDQAAAMVLARRLLGFREGIPSRGEIPLDGGGHVTFTRPEEDGVKHVWTLWGRLLGRLRLAHGVHHRRGRRRVAPPAEAGGVAGLRSPPKLAEVDVAAGLGSAVAAADVGGAGRTVIPGGIPGQESLGCWGDGEHGFGGALGEG